jgi:hypothetical protein
MMRAPHRRWEWTMLVAAAWCRLHACRKQSNKKSRISQRNLHRPRLDVVFANCCTLDMALTLYARKRSNLAARACVFFLGLETKCRTIQLHKLVKVFLVEKLKHVSSSKLNLHSLLLCTNVQCLEQDRVAVSGITEVQYSKNFFFFLKNRGSTHIEPCGNLGTTDHNIL